MTKCKKEIGVYIRFSNNDKSQIGLDNQLVECTRVAHEMYGKDISFSYYVDEGCFKKDTKGLEKMLLDAERGDLHSIFTMSFDNLFRSLPHTLKFIKELRNPEIKITSIEKGGISDWSSLLFVVMHHVVQSERAVRGERIKKKYR